MCRVVALALVALTLGCSDDTVTGPSSNAFSISGRIVDFRSRSAVAGAIVRFDNLEFGSRTATSDAQGNYSIRIPAFGSYELYVNDARILSISIETTQYRGDFYVNTTGCVGMYGLVWDTLTKKPVQGAFINGSPSFVTGSDGWYDIGGSCPEVLRPGNTTFYGAVHPAYEEIRIFAGRGPVLLRRYDFGLVPKAR